MSEDPDRYHLIDAHPVFHVLEYYYFQCYHAHATYTKFKVQWVANKDNKDLLQTALLPSARLWIATMVPFIDATRSLGYKDIGIDLLIEDCLPTMRVVEKYTREFRSKEDIDEIYGPLLRIFGDILDKADAIFRELAKYVIDLGTKENVKRDALAAGKSPKKTPPAKPRKSRSR